MERLYIHGIVTIVEQAKKRQKSLSLSCALSAKESKYNTGAGLFVVPNSEKGYPELEYKIKPDIRKCHYPSTIKQAKTI